MPEPSPDNQRIQTTCLLVLTTIATGVALFWLRPVMVPFVLAFFLTVVLTPIIETLRRRLRLPFILAVALTGAAGAALVALLISLVSSSVVQLQKNSASYTAKIDQLRNGIEDNRLVQELGLASFLESLPAPEKISDVVEEALDVAPSEPADAAADDDTQSDRDSTPASPENETEGAAASPGGETGSATGGATGSAARDSLFSGDVMKNVIVGTANSLVGVMSQAVLVLIFMMFLVTGRVSTGTLGDVERRIRGYVMTKVIVSSITGILVWIVLSILGIEMALVFGVFAFLLNFVPSVGSIISTVLPLPLVLFGDYSTATQVLAIALPGLVQFSVGNLVEPKMLGDSMDLHPVTILLALIFWGMIWGMVGALLATPIMAVVRILLEKEPLTRPVAELMAGRFPSERPEPSAT